MEKIFEGIADYEKSFELINRGYTPDVFSAGQWFETTEEVYWYFLEVLPPMGFDGKDFAICEFATGNLTNAFFQINGRYFCATVDWVPGYMRGQRGAIYEAMEKEAA